MDDHTLEESFLERDLGIQISSDLKASQHCLQAYSKANKMLGLMKREENVCRKQSIAANSQQRVARLRKISVDCLSVVTTSDLNMYYVGQRKCKQIVPRGKINKIF